MVESDTHDALFVNYFLLHRDSSMFQEIGERHLKYPNGTSNGKVILISLERFSDTP